MQAVVKIGSSQYLVHPGQELLVDRPIVDQILLVVDADKVLVGQPTVAEAHVSLKVLGDVKGKKVRVSKFKAKSRYRKTIGFRPQYTKVLVEDITLGAKETKPEEKSEKTPAKRARKTRETKS